MPTNDEREVAEVEVAIVGAGPAGMSAAITLASNGIKTVLLERRTEPSPEPRATVASTGTMELLRRWGLEGAAWDRSLDLEWTAWACPTLADADAGEAIAAGGTYRAWCRGDRDRGDGEWRV
jgi:putative polyketide hydroxylase